MDIYTEKLKADWVLLGDYSRYIFLSSLIDNKDVILNFRDLSIWISHGNIISVTNDCRYITINKHFPDINIFVPKNNDDLSNLPLKKNTKVLIFEEFPFVKESTQQIFDTMKEMIPLVVLINSYTFSASTDLTRKGEDFEEAKQWYLDKKINVLWINDLDNNLEIQNIVYWRPKLKDYYKKKMEFNLRELKELIQEVKYDFQLIYEEWCTDSKYYMNRKQICSYNTIKKTKKNSVWQAYMFEAYNILFPKDKSSGIYDVVTLYEDTIKESKLAVWNLDKDKEILLIKLQKKYGDVLKEPIKYKNLKKFILVSSIENEADYLNLITNPKSKIRGINVDFLKQVDMYIEKGVLEVLQSFLENKCIRLEQLIESNR